MFTGNATGVVLGDGALLIGNINNVNSLVITGTGAVTPGFQNLGNFVVNSSTPSVNTPTTADVVSSGSVTLSSTTSFSPILTGQNGTTQVFNFNTNEDDQITQLNIPATPVFSNGTYLEINPYGSLGSMNQNVHIDGGSPGQLVISTTPSGVGGANTGGGLDLAFGTNSTPDPNFDSNGDYDLLPVNISNQTTLNIVAKIGPNNQASTFIFGLIDVNEAIHLITVPMSSLNSTGFTTLSINLLAAGNPAEAREHRPARLVDYRRMRGRRRPMLVYRRDRSPDRA